MKECFLYDVDSIEFCEAISQLKCDLKNNNQVYRDIFYKIERMKMKYPVVRNILEDEEASQMNLEESLALLKVINLYRELFRMEEYEIFYLGCRENFGYLRRIEVIWDLWVDKV